MRKFICATTTLGLCAGAAHAQTLTFSSTVDAQIQAAQAQRAAVEQATQQALAQAQAASNPNAALIQQGRDLGARADALLAAARAAMGGAK